MKDLSDRAQSWRECHRLLSQEPSGGYYRGWIRISVYTVRGDEAEGGGRADTGDTDLFPFAAALGIPALSPPTVRLFGLAVLLVAGLFGSAMFFKVS